MSAKAIGNKLGRAAGWTGATLWKGTIALASATGELGEGFLEGTAEGFEQRSAELDLKFAEMKARNAAKVAEAMRLRAEAQAKVEAEIATAKRTNKAASAA